MGSLEKQEVGTEIWVQKTSRKIWQTLELWYTVQLFSDTCTNMASPVSSPQISAWEFGISTISISIAHFGKQSCQPTGLEHWLQAIISKGEFGEQRASRLVKTSPVQLLCMGMDGRQRKEWIQLNSNKPLPKIQEVQHQSYTLSCVFRNSCVLLD